MESQELNQLIQFLQTDLGIPDTNLQLALRHPAQTPTLIPIILWQYGLISLSQLDQTFDWFEQQKSV